MKHTDVRGFRPIAILLATLVTGILVLGTAGCGAGAVDTRCQIDAGPHGAKIADSVAESRLWRMYFDKVSGTSPLVELVMDVERRTKPGYGGDYNGGTVTVSFEVRSLKHGSSLLKEEGKFEIDMFLIGRFDKDATREEMQEIAFHDAEKESYPYVDRWIQLAAIKAMGREGKEGGQFVPALEKMVEDSWTSQDLRAASRKALAKIEG